MTNPYRVMCAELTEYVSLLDEPPHGLVIRARALLDQPEPEAPADEELDELFTDIDQGGNALSWRVYARAILDRWGTPNLAQVRSSLGDGSAVSDEEIMKLMPQQMREDLAQAARAMTGVDMASFDTPKAAGLIRIILNRHAVDHARAVLAKWGHQ